MRARLLSRWMTLCFAAAIAAAGACALSHRPSTHPTPRDERSDALKRAQVWTPTDIPAMDLMAGPQGPGAFAPGETVTCDYTKRDMNGRSPKFACVIAGKDGKDHDAVKVKYGRDNAEVYGEVLGTRLLWALGFGADRMYPVRVICRGCPASIKSGEVLPTGERLFDPAVIERKAPGHEIEFWRDQGWSWRELDQVDASAGGASRAQVDALKLLAVFIQHSDSKAEQQRLVCLDPRSSETPGYECAHPFMLIQDLGLTFGYADFFFRKAHYANLKRWAGANVWVGHEGCVGNLSRPFLGTLEWPAISEEGRQFLADLLDQLRDAQIQDLFAAARITLRSSGPSDDGDHGPTVDDWVAAFKHRRQEVADRRCPPASSMRARQ